MPQEEGVWELGSKNLKAIIQGNTLPLINDAEKSAIRKEWLTLSSVVHTRFVYVDAKPTELPIRNFRMDYLK
jgi:hypothetical protein